jgi:hypothetical protein
MKKLTSQKSKRAKAKEIITRIPFEFAMKSCGMTKLLQTISNCSRQYRSMLLSKLLLPWKRIQASAVTPFIKAIDDVKSTEVDTFLNALQDLENIFGSIMDETERNDFVNGMLTKELERMNQEYTSWQKSYKDVPLPGKITDVSISQTPHKRRLEYMIKLDTLLKIGIQSECTDKLLFIHKLESLNRLYKCTSGEEILINHAKYSDHVNYCITQGFFTKEAWLAELIKPYEIVYTSDVARKGLLHWFRSMKIDEPLLRSYVLSQSLACNSGCYTGVTNVMRYQLELRSLAFRNVMHSSIVKQRVAVCIAGRMNHVDDMLKFMDAEPSSLTFIEEYYFHEC